jgi:uncharacterized membrane protein
MLHHMTVHFPIALLIVAGGIYLFALFRPEHPYSPAAFLLHILGTLGIGASILSGNQVKSEIDADSPAADILQQHEILAYVMLWLFGMLLVWRYLRLKKIKKMEERLFSIVFLLAIALMIYSAFQGGNLAE